MTTQSKTTQSNSAPSKSTPSTPTGRIVVIGAGYSGLCAAARAGKSAQVTLIAPDERIPNRIRQHEVAAGRPVPKPRIAEVLRGRKVTHVQARVTELDLTAHKVFTDTGRAVEYDTLVYAIGSRTAWHGVPGAQEHAYSTEQAADLRERLAAAQTGRLAVVGGGATGSNSRRNSPRPTPAGRSSSSRQARSAAGSPPRARRSCTRRWAASAWSCASTAR